jgi:hypothetical protein
MPSVWDVLLRRPDHSTDVSMPSVSGWALRRSVLREQGVPAGFYALGFGLGFAAKWSWRKIRTIPVSMPSVSGWALRRRAAEVPGQVHRFYALGFGLGFATRTQSSPHRTWRFYALGFGLGFATSGTRGSPTYRWTFLCPRFRAGLCDRCGMEGLVTWRFAGPCANHTAPAAPIPLIQHGRALASRFSRADHPRKRLFSVMAVPGHVTMQNPGVLDDLRAVRSHLSRGAVIELNPGAVARQQRCDIPEPTVVGDVVGHHLSDYGRPARDAERPLTSIAPAGRQDRIDDALGKCLGMRAQVGPIGHPGAPKVRA